MTTRHNICQNPSAGVDLTGWTGSTCSPTRVTGLTGVPRTTGVRSTASGFFRTPAALIAPTEQITVSFYMTNNSGLFQFAHTVYISYITAGHGEQFPETFSTTNVADGGTVRCSFTATIANIPADATNIFLIIDTMPAGITISSVMFEQGSSLGSYFDGSFANSFWDGTADLTPSTYRLLDGVSIFGTDRPLTRDNSDGTNYTMGTLFSLTDAANALKVHFHAPTTPNPFPVTWQVWNVTTSTIIQQGTWPDSIVWGTWNEVTLSGLSLSTGILYAVTVVTNRYVATTHYFDSGITHSPVHADSGSGRFVVQAGTTPTLPDSGFNNGGYFVDIEVEAGAPPSGPQAFVWDGTTEHPATVSIWNGTAEVPATLELVP